MMVPRCVKAAILFVQYATAERKMTAGHVIFLILEF
jgi:hypothetical protein